MADWKFLNVLQMSYGFKGTILDGVADKYLVFPTEEDCVKLCEEAHEILKNHYETIYRDDKESLAKVQKILENKPKLNRINPSSYGNYHTPSRYDQHGNSQMFGNIIWHYKLLQKIDDEIIEKKALELMKAQLEEQKRLLKSHQHVDCSKCPTCNK
jgi:hypothetical protein